MNRKTIIISPHPDDEIIGCYSYLNHNECIIVYIDIDNNDSIDPNRIDETKNLNTHFRIEKQYYLDNDYEIPKELLRQENLFLFPDPINELHPVHRKQGQIGEKLTRKGFDIIFYSTNMNVPWLKEISNPNKKKDLLDIIYPSQKDLWKYDHKYFLFEAYHKWIF